MSEQVLRNGVLELDLVEYAKYNGKMPVIIQDDMLRVLSYNPTFQYERPKMPINLISDSSSLGKAIINDERVPNVIDIMPSIVDLYNTQKSLSVSMYFASNDNIVSDKEDEEKNSNVVNLPVTVHPKKPVEVNPGEDNVVSIKEPSEIKDYFVQPTQYGVQPTLFYTDFGGRCISNLETKLSHYKNKSIDLSNQVYYKR